MRAQSWVRRLERGKAPRWADLALRLCGTGLLALTAAAARLLWLMEARLGVPVETPGEAGIALALVVLLSLGLLLLVEGAQVFRLQPIPPRSWLPQWRRRGK